MHTIRGQLTPIEPNRGEICGKDRSSLRDSRCDRHREQNSDIDPPREGWAVKIYPNRPRNLRRPAETLCSNLERALAGVTARATSEMSRQEPRALYSPTQQVQL